MEALRRKYYSHFEKQEGCRKLKKTLLHKRIDQKAFHFCSKKKLCVIVQGRTDSSLTLLPQSAKAGFQPFLFLILLIMEMLNNIQKQAK